jgi:hypothetical protein
MATHGSVGTMMTTKQLATHRVLVAIMLGLTPWRMSE